MLKTIIKKIIGEYTFARIKQLVNKGLCRKKLVSTKYPLNVISGKYHTSCGYYDHSPVYGNKLLYFTTDSNLKKIVNHCVDLEGKVQAIHIKSDIANWQQGNRLIWIDSKRFIFNDFDGKKYISREYRNGDILTRPWPIYDANAKFAINIDFSRLGYLRPGYGYTNLPFCDIDICSNAIVVYDLETEDKIVEIKYGELLETLGRRLDINQCYINHISISPRGNRFLFFFIEKQKYFHMCYLGLWNNGEISFLERQLSASHYTWYDNNTILTTSYDENRKCGYYLYDILSGKRCRILEKQLVEDGHPTFVSAELFITDTYPDKNGFQKVKLVNLHTKEIETLVEIYSSAKHMGEKRCDLHPRYDRENKKIYFDADIDGHRRLYVLNMGEHEWIKEDEKKNSQ